MYIVWTSSMSNKYAVIFCILTCVLKANFVSLQKITVLKKKTVASLMHAVRQVRFMNNPYAYPATSPTYVRLWIYVNFSLYSLYGRNFF